MSGGIVSFDVSSQFRYLREKYLADPFDWDEFLVRVSTMYELGKLRYYEDFGYVLVPSHFLISDMIDEENNQIIEIYCGEDFELMDKLKVLYVGQIGLNMPEDVKAALTELKLEFTEPENNETYIGIVVDKRKTLFGAREQIRMFVWEELYDRDGDNYDCK